MNVAAATLEGRTVEKNDPHLRMAHASGTTLPDVLVFDQDLQTSRELRDDYQPRDADAWHFPNMVGVGALLVGISQRYAQSLVQHSLNGQSG